MSEMHLPERIWACQDCNRWRESDGIDGEWGRECTMHSSGKPYRCEAYGEWYVNEATVAALRARVAELEAELDELKSFNGIMRQIDEHYPLDIPYFHDSNDPGCVAMRAQRQCLLATQRAEKAEAERDALRAEGARMREALEKIEAKAPSQYEPSAEYWEWGNYDDAYAYGLDTATIRCAQIATAALQDLREGGDHAE